jgi:ring-1,2-phenylacetyl-CoA epoxidase subunit PaaC
LGDGTDESHQRMENAIDELWPYIDELFINAAYEEALLEDNIAVDVSALKSKWFEKILPIFNEATLQVPQNVFAKTGGKQGIHSEQLGYILAEMQFMQRAYPNSTW